MNQTIQQRRDILDGLRERANQARAEFNAKPRFVVVPHKNNLFGIVDRETGTDRAEVAGHMEACRAAQALERSEQFQKETHLGVRRMARLFLIWTAALGLILIGFAVMGMQH